MVYLMCDNIIPRVACLDRGISGAAQTDAYQDSYTTPISHVANAPSVLSNANRFLGLGLVN